MRGQRYSRHVKNCWRHFLQTRNSRRRFQVVNSLEDLSCICHSYEKHRVHPVRIAIPKMGKQLSSPFASAIIPPRTLPRRFHGPAKQPS